MSTDKGTVHWFNDKGVETIFVDVESPTIDSMEEYIGGKTEHVTVLYNGQSCSMFVHEFGRSMWADRNPTATSIYFAASKARGIDPEDEGQARKEVEALAESMGISHENIHYMEDPATAKPPGIYGPAVLLEGFKT